MLLVDAISNALVRYAAYMAGFLDAYGQMADRDVPHALALIGHVLDEYYPRRRKLHRQFAALVEAVRGVKPVDYARRRRSLQRALDRTKQELTGHLYEAFLQYGPSPPDFPREATYWAIATIMSAYALDGGDITLATDRIKKRCLKHIRPAR
jgi:hypothetical protein